LLIELSHRQTFDVPVGKFFEEVDHDRLDVGPYLLVAVPLLEANHTYELKLQC
jgi:hypothetical protein